MRMPASLASFRVFLTQNFKRLFSKKGNINKAIISAAVLLTVTAAATFAVPAQAFNNSLPVGSLATYFATALFGAENESVDELSSSSIDFESPLFTPGTPHLQNGWSASGAAPAGPGFDHQITDNGAYLPTPPLAFGTRSFRISNAVTSGAFGNQTFTSSLTDEAGETSAANDGMSGGTRQNRFAAEWQFTSADPSSEQVGLNAVASPDRGDGARMSWVQMVDAPTGLSINFNDYQRNLGNTCASGLNFVQTNVANGLAVQFTLFASRWISMTESPTT